MEQVFEKSLFVLEGSFDSGVEVPQKKSCWLKPYEGAEHSFQVNGGEHFRWMRPLCSVPCCLILILWG
jgi:hypothetical protein